MPIKYHIFPLFSTTKRLQNDLFFKACRRSVPQGFKHTPEESKLYVLPSIFLLPVTITPELSV